MKEDTKDKVAAHGILENENEKGSVRLNENVIASLVKMAACSVQGVLRLAGSGSIVDSIATMIGHKKSSDAIAISYEEDKLVLEIQIVVAYGINIPKLGQDVQIAVVEKIKEITGLDTAKVHVLVQDIEEENKPDEEAAQPPEEQKE